MNAFLSVKFEALTVLFLQVRDVKIQHRVYIEACKYRICLKQPGEWKYIVKRD